jgi:thymidylate synthase (FAD)
MKFVQVSAEILFPDGVAKEQFAQNIYKQIEMAARTCYQSQDKIMQGSAERVCKNLIQNGHTAMLEHASITVRFTVDRGITHEIVRHRMASFAQESRRYCNYSKEKFGENIKYIDLKSGAELDPVFKNLPTEKKNVILDEWFYACQDAERHYLRMLELGATPQIARSVLNNSTASQLVVTANIREWRHIFALRAVGTTGKPHPQMEEIMAQLLHAFADWLPALFGDLDDEYLAFCHTEKKEG